MKEKIPFTKEIDFKENISTITSISLEHQENIKEGEINGNFTVFGDYKIHSDTTEKELFKYNLPFTTILPNGIDENSIKIDIDDFTYDILEDHIMRVNIDYTIEGDRLNIIDDIKEERNEIIENEEIPIIEYVDKLKNKIEEKEPVIDETEESTEINTDFVTYNVHIVKENDTIESILSKYNTNIDNLKIYNNITNLNIGDKIIIPTSNE